MASKDPEEPFNTETDEETVALRKKRLRRVSFADREITSVHIFNRDDDYEQEFSTVEPSSVDDENEVLGFFRDLAADSDDSKDMSPEEGDDNEEIASRKSFLRPIESPSPGSSIVGSATSNDEDNFFGPVSASFIRPRRLSDSAPSDDNHDITMDSTAFSMHFRSLVSSEQGDINTPTGDRIAFEEKTSSQVGTPSDPGSFMVLTKVKKPLSQTSPAVGKVGGSRDSNDMSLVGENPYRYDYGRLSPTLEAILAGGSEDMQAVPIFETAINSNSLKRNEVLISNENGSGMMDTKDNGDTDMCNFGPDNMSQEAISAVHFKLGEVNKEVDGTKNVEFPNVGSDTPLDLKVISNICRLSLFSQPEPEDLCSTQDSLEMNSSKVGLENSQVDQKPESPLAGSITTLSAKRRQIFLDATNSSRCSLNVTPSPKQPGSLLRKENIKLGESVSSLKKSISRFKIIGSSPHASTLKNGLEKSEERVPEHPSSAMSPFYAVMEETSRDLQHKHVDPHIMNLEKHLLSVDRKDGEHKNTINMDSDGSRALKNFGRLNQNGDTMFLAKDGEPLDNLSIRIFDEDKLAEMVAAMPSHSQLTSSGKKVVHQVLMSNNSLNGMSNNTGSDSSSLEIALDHGKGQKATNNSINNVSPPVKTLDQKLLSAADYQGCLSGDLKHQVQHKKFNVVGSPSDGNSMVSATNGSHLTEIADKLDSLFVDHSAQSSSPLLEINHIKDFIRIKREDDRKILPSALQNVSEVIGILHTPSRDTGLLKFQLGSPDKNYQIANDPIQTRQELPQEEIKASVHKPASPHVERSLNESLLLKSPFNNLLTQSSKEPTLSPSQHMHLLAGKDGLSSKFILDEHGNDDCFEGLDNSHNQFQLQDFENSSRRKRRSEEVVLGDADNVCKTNWIQRSSIVHKRNKGNDKIGVDAILKHWTDILHKFSTETNQILSPLIDKLNIKAIDMLEDILVHLQKVNNYGMLCSDILSQKIYDHSSNLRHKRVSETRLLLHKIVYKKAKLQILRRKHEKLLKIIQILSSGMQKFHILKLNYARHLSTPGERDAQVADKLHQLAFVNSEGKHEVVADKVATRRQEVEALDRKIKNLIKFFNNHCKMKGELSCDETIVLLNDYLKKRACCRYIRQDLQLWEISDLERTHGHYNLVLNYHGFISQRFTIIADPVSSMAISNKVNDMNIKMNFPNMDACAAFAFVFNSESTKKAVGSKSLAQETQKTSSLLCNLLAVIEEVQLARIEIRNLTNTSFNSPSVEQLDLHLCFIDLNSGAKVTMTLDMTCLNRGIYPSEILPYQLLVATKRTHDSLPESLSAEINTAIGNLTNGYSRIIRLCRHVSQVMQSSR